MKELKIKTFLVTVDSIFLCKQVNKEFKLKSEHLQEYFDKVQELLTEFNPPPKIIQVPRKYNAVADELANKGIDEYLKNNNV